MGILTGPEIHRLVDAGEITIDPYDPRLVGPNSVDCRLHKSLLVYEDGAEKQKIMDSWMRENEKRRARCTKHAIPFHPSIPEFGLWPPKILDMGKDNPTVELEIPDEGLVLWPGILYLGRTVERVGSDTKVPWCDGRSSVGRLGIHVHVTAGKGDTGWFGTFTLEIGVMHPIRVYANRKPLCQVTFFDTVGDLEAYKGRYQDQVAPVASRIHLDEYDRS